MKKILLSAMILAISGVSFANLSPSLRGETTQTITHHHVADLLTTPVAGVPIPKTGISQVQTLPTTLINVDNQGTTQMDVTLIDDLLDDLAPNARHYPTNFPNRTAEHLADENIKYLSDWLEPYASAKNASFELILRTAKVNGMAKNLNLGNEYAQRASKYMAQAVKMSPNHPEANFLYGMMISEAGGFLEGQKYLVKASGLGFIEAEQSLAQAELLSDNHTGALNRLKALQAKHPNHPQLSQQISIVENGGFYIWNLKDNNLNLKPVPTH